MTFIILYPFQYAFGVFFNIKIFDPVVSNPWTMSLRFPRIFFLRATFCFRKLSEYGPWDLTLVLLVRLKKTDLVPPLDSPTELFNETFPGHLLTFSLVTLLFVMFPLNTNYQPFQKILAHRGISALFSIEGKL